MELKNILKLLEEQFTAMREIFKTDDWKFYKFGLGGPYKRSLSKLRRMSDEYDPVIYKFFGITQETATFASLIVLCLRNESHKELYKHIDTFERQIKRMRKQV